MPDVLCELGTVPCAAADVSVCARLGGLRAGQLLAVFCGRRVLLCVVHSESVAVQCDVASVSASVQGDAVRPAWRCGRFVETTIDRDGLSGRAGGIL